MRGPGRFIGGILAGIGLAYLLDPDRGARRRALVRDKAASAGRRLADELDATTRDLRNRAKGRAAELGAKFKRQKVDDETLHERVRSAIGRVLSHPGGVDVDVLEGRVTLRGPVLADERDELITTVRGVRGVADVIDQTTAHSAANGVPALQGEGTRQSS
jgi:osmotically-inducible protein OsmY